MVPPTLTTDAASALIFGTLSPGSRLDGHARVLSAETARAQTGSLFHRLTLGDPAGGQLTARRFDVGEELAPAVGSVVRITGVLEDYRGRTSLKMTSCVADGILSVDAFVPRMPACRLATLADLDALIAELTDPILRSWVEAYFDPQMRTQLAAHPAAARNHGARHAGLISHTVRVARIALGLADLVPLVDRDVVLSGALLHDGGKLTELLDEPGLGYSEEGALVGHIVLGVLRASEVAASIPALEPAILASVLHVIIASHGKIEFGSPVVPATLEALIVHLADLAEAKLEAALEAIERTPLTEPWTPYLPAFGSRLRVKSS